MPSQSSFVNACLIQLNSLKSNTSILHNEYRLAVSQWCYHQIYLHVPYAKLVFILSFESYR